MIFLEMPKLLFFTGAGISRESGPSYKYYPNLCLKNKQKLKI